MKRGRMEVIYATDPYYYPVFKPIIEKFGRSTARTFGLIWQLFIDQENQNGCLEIDQETLQHGLNRSYSTVRKHINRLEKAGYIDAERENGKQTKYYLTTHSVNENKDEYKNFRKWQKSQYAAEQELEQKQKYQDLEREKNGNEN